MSLPFTLLLDPADPASMFPPPVQMLVAGNTIQRGRRLADERSSMGHGYGLRLDDSNEVHSFPTLDGETLRLGVDKYQGIPMLRQRHQFIPDEGYEYRPGIRNDTTGPNSDRLRNDGIRTRYNCIPIDENDPIGWSNSFGDRTGSKVIMATYFRVPSWALLGDLNACIVGMHAPKDGPASPFTSFLGQGRWGIVHRDSRVPLKAKDPAPRGEYVGEVDVTESDVGDLWAVVVEAEFDPIVGRFRCWVNKAGKGWETVVDRAGGWGWGYAPTDPQRRLWYAILDGFYSWKNAPSSVAPLNWDVRQLTRELWYGPSALFVDEDVAAKSVGEWIETRMTATQPPPLPPAPDPPPGLNLEQRVADLESRMTAMQARRSDDWAALGAAALKISREATDQ